MSHAIYFTRVGKTKTGRGLYKLCSGKGGKPIGRAFTIGGQSRKKKTARTFTTEKA